MAKAETAPSPSEELEALKAELASVKQQLAAAEKSKAKTAPAEPMDVEGQKIRRISSGRCDAEKMLATVVKHWPKSREEAPPKEIILKSYLVKGVGGDSQALEPLVVDDCSDAGDALAAFWTEHQITGFKRHAVAKQVA